MKWEEIHPNMHRTKVPGGWLVKCSSPITINDQVQYIESITYILDEYHTWRP